jgi:hypothetical protein
MQFSTAGNNNPNESGPQRIRIAYLVKKGKCHEATVMTCEVTWADHGPGLSCPAGAKCSDPPRRPLPDQSIPFPGTQKSYKKKLWS